MTRVLKYRYEKLTPILSVIFLVFLAAVPWLNGLHVNVQSFNFWIKTAWSGIFLGFTYLAIRYMLLPAIRNPVMLRVDEVGIHDSVSKEFFPWETIDAINFTVHKGEDTTFYGVKIVLSNTGDEADGYQANSDNLKARHTEISLAGLNGKEINIFNEINAYFEQMKSNRH
jgi:hypothetical protein